MVQLMPLPPDSFKAQLNTIQLMQLPTQHVFNCTTALFLSAAVRLPVEHHYCSYYFHGTHLYLQCGAILLDHRVGTFIGRRPHHLLLIKIQNGFTCLFLVLAYPDFPGKVAARWVSVFIVIVC